MIKHITNKTLLVLAAFALFVFCYPTDTKAQTKPGNVSNDVTLWLKADEVTANTPVMSEGTRITRWEDKSGKGNHFGQYSTHAYPGYTYDGFSYQPAILFSAFSGNASSDNATKLTSLSTFPFSSTNTVITVSKDTRSGATVSAAVFAFKPDFHTGWTSSSNANYLYTTNGSGTSSYEYINGGLGKRYGIVVNQYGTYTHNGNSVTGASGKGPTGTVGTAIIGNGNLATSSNLPFFGEIYEIIVLSGTMNSNDLEKVNSYLAIKYGQTLQSGYYCNSDHTSVWNTGINSGYTSNVFGIARDDASNLYKKQAKSAEDGKLTVYLGNTLYTLNANNGGVIAVDKTYLMFGSNGVSSGLTSYEGAVGDVFVGNGAALAHEIRFRQNVIYRAQITSPSVTSMVVSMAVDMEADYIVVSQTPTFSRTANNTRLYRLYDGKAQNITINDGDFVGFLTTLRKPGNTSLDLDLWLKADEVQRVTTPSDGASITVWNDKSGNDMNFVQDGSYEVPTYNMYGMNYNPTLYFKKSSDTYRNLKLVSKDNFVTDGSKRYYTIYVSDFSNNLDQQNSAKNSGTTYAPIFSYAGNSNSTDIETNARDGWYISSSSSNYNYLYMGYAANASSSFANPGLTPRYGIVTSDRSGGAIYHNGKSSGALTPRPVPTKTDSKAVISKRYLTGSSGNYSNATLGDYVGKVSEIIVLSSASSTIASDLDRIHSYLAIKYGQTLYDTGGNPASYYNSDATVPTMVWNANDGGYSSYNTGVFGIARDEGTSLNQKQSMNVDHQKLVVFAGNTLYPTSGQNPTEIPDGVYLMLGSNGQTGSIAFSNGDGAPFANGIIMSSEITTRHSLIYRARVTSMQNPALGQDYPVEIGVQPLVNADYVMVCPDTGFDKSNTDLYPVTGGTATGITIKDGYYIGFAAIQKAPARVFNELKMWLKADEPSTLTRVGNEVQEWRDFSGASKEIKYWYNPDQGANWTARPAFKTTDAAMNYHPAVHFRTTGEFLSSNQGPFEKERPEYYTFVSVVNVEQYPDEDIDGGKTAYILGFGNITPTTSYTGGTSNTGTVTARRPAIGIAQRSGKTDGVGRYHEASAATGGERYIYGTKHLFNSLATTIMLHEIHVHNSSGTELTDNDKYLLFESDGYTDRITNASVVTDNASQATNNSQTTQIQGGVNGSGSTYANLSTAPSMLGIGSRPQRQFQGTMGEVIAYERKLEPEEKEVIYSYLGIKYGITLDLDKLSSGVNFDYKMSDKTTVIWPGTNDPTADGKYRKYHHNVAGLVRDDQGGFNNMQARSTNTNSIVRIGIGEVLGENPVLTGLDTDYESLMWGNDGTGNATVDYQGDVDICGQMESRMAQLWMLDNTRTSKNYKLTISAGGLQASGFFPYFGAGFQVYLLIADSEADFTKAADGSYGFTIIQGTFINGEHHFTYEFENDENDNKKDYVYFTFGGKKQAGVCDACESTDQKVMKFTANTIWKRGATTRTYDDLTEITPTISFDWVNQGSTTATTARFYSGNPRGVSYNSLRVTRTQSSTPVLRYSISLAKAAKAEFVIYEIDKRSTMYDNVSVYGLCGVTDMETVTDANKFLPELSYVDSNPKTRTYTIYENQGKAIATKTASAYSKTAQMNVRFQFPVEKIIIEHAITKGKTGYKRLGLGPITFTCPTPPLPTNEDGLSFQMSAPQSVSLCEEVRYTYRITNTNCATKGVYLTNTLPDGLVWTSVSVGSFNETKTECVVDFTADDGRTLTIDSLYLPGGGEYTVFAFARFRADQVVTKDYSTQATIKYVQVINDHPYNRELPSCDAILSTTTTCAPTVVTGEYTGERAIPVETSMVTTSCYREDDIINVNITLKNPNDDNISQTTFSVGYNDEFEYIPESLTSTLSGIDEDNMIDFEEEYDIDGNIIKVPTDGYFYFENLNIAANGEYTISFKLKAPSQGNLGYVPDDDGNPTSEIVPLGLEYMFESDMEDICLLDALINAYGSMDISYCSGERVIFINEHLLHILK